MKKHSLLIAFFTLIFFGCSADDSANNPGPEDIDFTYIETEQLGGDGSVANHTNVAFSQPMKNLTPGETGQFRIGNSFFETDWVAFGASTTALDGLGPLFNARSCASCHNKDGRGRPPEADETFLDQPDLLLRLSINQTDEITGGPIGDPNYGGQLQINSLLGIEREGRVTIRTEEINGQFADGTPYTLLKPIYEIDELTYGPLDPEIQISPRVAPFMVGLGLLEAVSEATILEYADPDDTDGDGISGRANYVWDLAQEESGLGRFGWKANQPNLAQQTQGAFLGDIGITSQLFPDQNCTDIQTDCLESPTDGEIEVNEEILAAVVFYSQTLAVPTRRNIDDPQVIQGAELFSELSCQKCHRTQMTTAPNEVQALSEQTIFPYTDLLLHDMGPELADNRPDFLANGREWRTAPLWGIGLVQKVNNHTRFLHDGRARSLIEAILWHGGEAEASKQAFLQLTKEQRDALIAFLRSL